MPVHWDDQQEPVFTTTTGDVQCEMFDDCHMPAHAKVCGSRCRCRVNVCDEHAEFMDGRFKCPFTGEL